MKIEFYMIYFTAAKGEVPGCVFSVRYILIVSDT